VSAGEEPSEEPEASDAAAETETETEADTEADGPEAEAAAPETEPVAWETESQSLDYSLFVPGPSGYELVPQTGVPPQAGETVELVLPDREEPARFEVVRSGRTLRSGDVCVYLAQV